MAGYASEGSIFRHLLGELWKFFGDLTLSGKLVFQVFQLRGIRRKLLLFLVVLRQIPA